MSDLLGDAAGVRPEFTFNGTRYRVCPPTQAAKARYESLVVAAEKLVIEDMAANGLIDAAERRAMYAELTRQVSIEAAHRVGGALWAEYGFGGKGRVGLALYYLSLVDVADGPAWRAGGAADIPAAVQMFDDEGAGLAFAEALPSFVSLAMASLPARVRETPAFAAGMAQFAAAVAQLAAPKPPPPPAEVPDSSTFS